MLEALSFQRTMLQRTQLEYSHQHACAYQSLARCLRLESVDDLAVILGVIEVEAKCLGNRWMTFTPQLIDGPFHAFVYDFNTELIEWTKFGTSVVVSRSPGSSPDFGQFASPLVAE